MKFNHIELQQEKNIITIVLNRPEVHNALNESMIKELNVAIEELWNKDFRILILKGNGKSFCAGADLNYMKNIAQYNFEENVEDAKNLANLLYKIYNFPKPTIAIGHGNIIGGGIGLISCCDFSFCENTTLFVFSEVKLGLIPAVISPYIIRKIGIQKTRELFLTGEKFNAEFAEKIGLITRSVKKEEMDSIIYRYLELLISNAPSALKEIKELIEINLNHNLEELKNITSEIIAKIRSSKEAQEGMASFLEKRKPKWIPE